MILKEEFTKNQCQKLFTDMISDFEDCFYLDIQFDSSKVDKQLYWLNQNNRRALGKCKSIPFKHYYSDDFDYDADMYDEDEYYIDHEYKVYLNPNCLKFSEDAEKIIKETLAHELCHTMKGCMNHGPDFHRNGNIIFKNFGYKIDTTADEDASRYFNSLLPEHPYMLQCVSCDKKFYQDRLSDPVKNPGRYKCACGDNLNSYKLNKSTGEYELYKKFDDSLDYKYYARCNLPDCDFRQGFKTRNSKFLGFIRALKSGKALKCPECGRDDIYIYDDGDIISQEITFDDFKYA